MTAPTISNLPEVPPTNDADFETKAPALFNAIKNTFVGEVNDFGDYLNTTDWLTLALGLSANKLTYSDGTGDVVVANELNWDSINKRLGINSGSLFIGNVVAISSGNKLESNGTIYAYSTNQGISFAPQTGTSPQQIYTNYSSGGAEQDLSLGTFTYRANQLYLKNDGNVGIGTSSPNEKLHLHESTSGENYLRITNSSTGETSTDGLQIGLSIYEEAIFRINESNSIYFQSGGTSRLVLDSSSGSAIFGGAVRVASYTVATVPSASSNGAGAQIYVTNETGGAVPCFSDGTNWRRVTDRAIIS